MSGFMQCMFPKEDMSKNSTLGKYRLWCDSCRQPPPIMTKSLHLGWSLNYGGLTVATSKKKPPQTAVIEKIIDI